MYCYRRLALVATIILASFLAGASIAWADAQSPDTAIRERAAVGLG